MAVQAEILKKYQLRPPRFSIHVFVLVAVEMWIFWDSDKGFLRLATLDKKPHQHLIPIISVAVQLGNVASVK